MAIPEVEAVDFEPEDDDLMDEDVDAAAAPTAPIPKLKSAITGSSSFSAPKKTKGRGFREESTAAQADRIARLSARFDTLEFEGGPGPVRCELSFKVFFSFVFFLILCVVYVLGLRMFFCLFFCG